MKIKIIVVIVLCFAMLFPKSISASATAEDTAWKKILRDFLANDFPHLFDEETNKRNNEEIKKYFDGIYDFEELSSVTSSDILKSYFIIPYNYFFHDLDFDGIPEVIIMSGMPETCLVMGEIYKLYGKSYKSIGYMSGPPLYINPENKIVSVDNESTQLLEIKNKEIVYSEYIDSMGNDSYKGVKYSEIGSSSGFFSFESHEAWLACDLFLADLRYIPEFDCSDVVEAAKNSKYSPKTGDNTLIFLVSITAICFTFVKTKRILKGLKNV